ncbi:LCM-domain-containing protein [Delitschia confertaspora ATCC 74209]|uniref:tRNA wybutosine-synthesizing protein 4 n=1 Tax=Delitschia confertaspora ATCC 74209 TaxID=1513339 RepID=A0A9P4MU37_9PLEO|nr:LCM-domain-containing protein [Delitschia confertaspora ATCC 74209]
MEKATDPSAPQKRPPRKLRPVRAKRDDSVMGTNDSSIASKRSVSKLYYPNEPDFYEPFTPKFQRRNPLINRGYWLRMYAIEHAVRRFLEKDDGNAKVVVNLGCGYDPTPFEFWHRHASLCQQATFIDVDYPQLIEKKMHLLSKGPFFQEALKEWNQRPSDLPVYVRSDRYLAVGCDLRELAALERILKAEMPSGSSVLFVAEVSITYMKVSDADALIQWASTIPNSNFCLLEQCLPDGPDHPFAQTMLKHFHKLTTPIHAVELYRSLYQQKARFATRGWKSVIVRNLWDLWSDPTVIGPEQRRHLDKTEPFDEWEEFALFGGHYFLLVAMNSSCEGTEETAPLEVSKDQEAREGRTMRCQFDHFKPYFKPDFPGTPRRFGAGFAVAHGHPSFAVHGGQSIQNRLASVDWFMDPDVDLIAQPRLEAPIIGARMCHTITTINGTNALLVGGRTSPNRCMADCWFLTEPNGQWIQVEDIKPGRFRHTATNIPISSTGLSTEAVLIFGGKTGSGQVLDDWKVWIPTCGWRDVDIIGDRPPARFGCSLSSFHESTRGLLFGGMDSNGIVLEDIWEWELMAESEIQLRVVKRTVDVEPGSTVPYARIGASLLPFGSDLILIGGVAKNHVLSYADEILVVDCSSNNLRFERIERSDPEGQRPLLVGFSAAVMPDSYHMEIVISGGGAVCFSMGSFWNLGCFAIGRVGHPKFYKWQCRVLEARGTLQAKPSKRDLIANKGDEIIAKKEDMTIKTETIPRLRINSAEDFAQIVTASKPVILSGLNLGPCVHTWTPDYLKEKIGADRSLVVHECSDNQMKFRDKNFSYIKKTFTEFMDGVVRGEKMYLRSLSSDQPSRLPTKLSDDFPTIASDFHIPDILTPIISENLHSSPLRISGPVSLWLHYDVLANILCQIRGSKTLILYPPSDVKYLDFPPGGSSSNINVLSPTLFKDHPNLRYTHPHRASLCPGDVLFIPPMWSHTATPDEGVSVAVNVFFRSLGAGYAAGKDVYGNRDLQAYENGRRDVAKIIKAFKGLPGPQSQFYLERLAAELRDKADELGNEGGA